MPRAAKPDRAVDSVVLRFVPNAKFAAVRTAAIFPVNLGNATFLKLTSPVLVTACFLVGWYVHGALAYRSDRLAPDKSRRRPASRYEQRVRRATVPPSES